MTPYLRHLLSYGHQTYRTCRPRGRLLYYGPVAGLRLSVWPLGGAKGFSFPLNISPIFEIYADISTVYGSTPQELQIPPCHAGIPPPIWGPAPKIEIFFDRIVTSSQNDSRCKHLRGDRGGRPLRPRKISMGLGDFFTEIGDFFDFFDVP